MLAVLVLVADVGDHGGKEHADEEGEVEDAYVDAVNTSAPICSKVAHVTLRALIDTLASMIQEQVRATLVAIGVIFLIAFQAAVQAAFTDLLCFVFYCARFACF